MTRGFSTGLAAASAFFALSVLWLLSASLSDRDVSDLTAFHALRVAEISADAVTYASTALADAEGDAAFFVHGCTPQGSYCTHVRDRIVNYTNASVRRLSGSGISVRAHLFNFSCVALDTPAAGFTAAYALNISLNVSLQGGPVRALRWVNQSDVVLVNSSSAFRSRVNSSGPAGVWDVRVDC